MEGRGKSRIKQRLNHFLNCGFTDFLGVNKLLASYFFICWEIMSPFIIHMKSIYHLIIHSYTTLMQK